MKAGLNWGKSETETFVSVSRYYRVSNALGRMDWKVHHIPQK